MDSAYEAGGICGDDFRSPADFRRRRALERRAAAGLSALAAHAIPGLPIDGDPPETRKKPQTLGPAVDRIARALAQTDGDGFLSALSARWREMFPAVKAFPSRLEGRLLFLGVKSSALLYMTRPALPEIRRRLAGLPGAPAGLEVKLEIRR